MAAIFNQKTAQQVVETVREVCGYHINYIDTDGYILASTDESRIGDYHEIGKKCVTTGEAIEVNRDDEFAGTHKGLNFPIWYNREIIGVVGISGDPNEVRKYAILAQKISSLILRERELDSIDYDRRGKMNYILHSLFEDKNINYLTLTEFFESNNLKIDDEYRVIIVKTEQNDKMRDTAAIENWVNTCFGMYGSALYTFVYPSEFWLVITDKQYKTKKNIISDIISYDGCRLCVSVGRKTSAKRLSVSYHSAVTALKSIDDEKQIVCYDDLTLEILFGELSGGEKKSFSEKILHNLTEDEIKLLKLYYDEDMSLAAVAEKRYMHKNTLQYKLNKIEEKCGFNPRVFKDAVLLFLACKMHGEKAEDN